MGPGMCLGEIIESAGKRAVNDDGQVWADLGSVCAK